MTPAEAFAFVQHAKLVNDARRMQRQGEAANVSRIMAKHGEMTPEAQRAADYLRSHEARADQQDYLENRVRAGLGPVTDELLAMRDEDVTPAMMPPAWYPMPRNASFAERQHGRLINQAALANYEAAFRQALEQKKRDVARYLRSTPLQPPTRYGGF